MNFRKSAILLIVLMILTPSFAFATESEENQNLSQPNESFERDIINIEDSKKQHTEPNDTELLENEQEELQINEDEIEENIEEMITFAAAEDIPTINTEMLTTPQKPEIRYINDSYLTNTFSGAASYAYPIQLPKGVANFHPKIELKYNSQSAGGVYGWLGDGWTLNDYYIQRDVNYTPTNTADDKFKLIFDGIGHDLIYNEENGYYHTEIETYMKIQKESGGENQKSEYWVIKTSDGIEYRLGYTDDSELLNSIPARDYAVKWKLDQIKDLKENVIAYTYIENPTQGEVGTSYLTKIDYNNGFNTIEFERTEKSVTFDNYKDGTYTSEKSLLSSIVIKTNEKEINRHEIQYETKNNHISLKSITLSDGVEELPPTIFSYGDWAGTYERNTSWNIPVLFVHNDISARSRRNVDQGANFVDINGDGYPDIVHSMLNNHARTTNVWINTGNEFVRDSYRSQNLNNTTYFNNYYNGHIYPTGARIMDINGDGLPDIVDSYYNSNDRRIVSTVWINTGNEFVRDRNWTLPVSFENNSGTRIVDLNGDGLPDIVDSGNVNSRYSRAWINNGTGFEYNSAWEPPILFYNNSATAIADINGDGLPDMIQSSSGGKVTYINTGEGFIRDNTKQIPVILGDVKYGEVGTRFLDFNKDGLTDIIQSHDSGSSSWMNTGTKFTNIGKNVPFQFIVTIYQLNSGARITDINADGLPDVVRSSYIRDGGGTFNHVWINSPNSTPNLLTEIKHSTGSTTKIEYSVSTHYDNRDENGMHQMSVPIPVVKKITTDNGMKNDQKTNSITTFDYAGGILNIEPKGKTEFRGFRQVTVNDGRSITEHYFHQDQAKKGREYKTIIKSNSNELYIINENEFEANETNDIFEVLLKNSTQSLYDGQTVPVVSKTSYEYDIYGNPIKTRSEGDISIEGDEKTVLYEYTYNVNDWILNKVKKETLENANSKKIAESEFYYDSNSNLNAVPTRGLITKTINWNSQGNDIVQTFEYDSYGNLIAQYDGNGHLTTVEYGENPIYPISFTNALNQKTLLEYNMSVGKLTKTTDPNGFETMMEYDGFGRITKVIKPGDSSSSPTMEYRYYIDGVAPEYIQISVKENENQYYDTWKYYDGLNREIKTESESENPSENIIQETHYNNFGNVSKIVAPRTSSETYLNTTTEYDSLGRLIKITNPDGTAKSVEYSQLKTTAFDERGNKIQSEKDIYGNIIKVMEFNGNDVYETGYEYNTLNNLIKIIPNQNYDQSKISFLVEKENKVMGGLENTNLVENDLSSLGLITPIDTRYKVENVSFEYDSLGRLIKLDDPDLGVWRYEYNTNGKKAMETDSRQVKTYYSYDALDRIVLIDYPNDTDISFEYDSETIGTLSKANSGIITKSYQYDERLRVIKETILIHNGDLSISENSNSNEDFQIYSAGIFSGFSLSKLKDAIKTVVEIVVNVVTEIYNAITGSNNNSSNGNSSSDDNGSGDSNDSDPNTDDDDGSGSDDEPEIPQTFVTTYSYDSMDRITQKTLPTGETVNYIYNNQALLSSISGVIDNISYNSMNLMTRKDFANGVSTDLTYDGWTKRLENINTPGLQNLDYSFDEKGNVIGISDNILNENQYFFYDELDRLILAGSENYAQSFAYNPLGSILAHRSKDLATGDEIVFGFEYGKNAGIHAPTRVGDMELLYDSNGNLIEDGSFSYAYNDANRLVKVLKKVENNKVIAEFFYDESGNRIKKIEDGIVSYYITKDYDIEDGEGTVYYFANGGRVAKNSDEGMFWYLDDHLGSTNVMINADGELVERTLYYPFGSQREGGEEKYSFTGKEFDSEIGLYYYGARHYNPETFVFTQADTLIPNVYNPQALNRYSYCYNNPLKYTDPDGHEPITLFIIGGTAIGALAGAMTGLYKGLDDAWVRYYEAPELTSELYAEMLKDVGRPTIGYTVEGAGAGLSITVGAVAAIGGEVVGGPAGAIGAVVLIGGGVSILSGGVTEFVWAGLEGKSLDESLDAAKEGAKNGEAGIIGGVMSVLVPGTGEAMSNTFGTDRGYGSDGRGHEYRAADVFEYSQNSLGSTRPQYTQAELRRMNAKSMK